MVQPAIKEQILSDLNRLSLEKQREAADGGNERDDEVQREAQGGRARSPLVGRGTEKAARHRLKDADRAHPGPQPGHDGVGDIQDSRREPSHENRPAR